MSVSIETNWLKTRTRCPPATDVRTSSRSATSLPESSSPNSTREAEEARVARRLTEPREAGEDLDVALRHALTLDLAHDLRAHFLEDRRVERRLLAGELAELIGLDLLGEILRDLGLRAAEDERVDRGAEALGGLLIARVDGTRVTLLELVERAEQAGADEVEDRPDLGEAILDRRAGEREAALGLEALGGARRGAERVLDVLRLVEDRVAEIELGEELLVATEQRVARDHDVGVVELVGALLAIGAVPDHVRRATARTCRARAPSW